MSFGAPPYDNGALLCIPIYKPDRGHEDKDTHTGGFIAVVHPDWKGAVTSECVFLFWLGLFFNNFGRASLARELNRYPGARTFSAFTWSRFHDLWILDCSEHHDHEYESPETRAKFALRIRQQRRTEEHYRRLVATDKAIQLEEEEEKRVKEEERRVKEEERRVKKEEMDYLAATRPPPVPLSPQRARQLFERVLGPGAGTPPPSPPKASSQPTATSDGPATIPSPPQTPLRTGTFLEHAHQRTCQLQLRLPAYAEVEGLEGCEAPWLYAVRAGSHNRVFNNR
jgi:hypothetical protein